MLTLISVRKKAEFEPPVLSQQLLSTSRNGFGINPHIRTLVVVFLLQTTRETLYASRHLLVHDHSGGTRRMDGRSEQQCCLVGLVSLGDRSFDDARGCQTGRLSDQIYQAVGKGEDGTGRIDTCRSHVCICCWKWWKGGAKKYIVSLVWLGS